MAEGVHQGPALVHRALSDPSRARILDALRQADDGLDAAQLAEAVGLHANTVRSHLRLLEEAGLVSARRDAQGQPGRPHILFDLSARPQREDGYRVLAGIFARHLADSGPVAGAGAEAAGRAWGISTATRVRDQRDGTEPVARVVELLDRLGFEPDLDADTAAGPRIVMNACAFGDLTDDYDDVVCAVHLGLIRGALAGLGAPHQAASLDRHSEAGTCVACLAPRDAA